MATIETNPQLGEQVRADAKEFVLHSWSVQDAINPIPVAGAEGRYFWDYDGQALPRLRLTARQRLDRARPPEGDRGDQGAGREALHDRAADGDGAALAARPDAGRGDAGQPEDVVLHERRRGGERERDQARALVHRAAQGDRALPLLPRCDRRRDHAHGRSAALVRGARAPGRRAHARPVHLPLPRRPSRSLPRLHGRAAPRGDPPVRGPAHGRRRHPGDRRRHERRHRPARRLPAVDPRDVRQARRPAHLRRGDGRLRPHRQVVRVRELGRRPGHPHDGEGDQLGLRAARRDDGLGADLRVGARQVHRGRAHLQRPSARLRHPRSPRSRPSARRASSRTRPSRASSSRRSYRSSPSGTRRSATCAASASSGASSS